MKKTMKKVIYLNVVLVSMLFASTTVFAATSEVNKEPSKNLTTLDIKVKYNPLRTGNQQDDVMYKSSQVEFNDENVQIERITYYDEFGKKTKEYRNKEALKHLLETERQQPSLNTTKEISKMIGNVPLSRDANRFETRVIETYVDTSAKTKIIRKQPLSIDSYDARQFIFDAGLAFAKPVISILNSTISQFLPTSVEYKAGDVNKTEYYRNFEKYGQLKDRNQSGSPWFSPIIIKKRLVDLGGSYYIVNNKTGSLTKFYADFSTVEENYNPLWKSSDTKIIDLALSKWGVYPYNHVYNWDKYLWPKDGRTTTFSPRVLIVKS